MMVESKGPEEVKIVDQILKAPYILFPQSEFIHPEITRLLLPPDDLDNALAWQCLIGMSVAEFFKESKKRRSRVDQIFERGKLTASWKIPEHNEEKSYTGKFQAGGAQRLSDLIQKTIWLFQAEEWELYDRYERGEYAVVLPKQVFNKSLTYL